MFDVKCLSLENIQNILLVFCYNLTKSQDTSFIMRVVIMAVLLEVSPYFIIEHEIILKVIALYFNTAME